MTNNNYDNNNNKLAESFIRIIYNFVAEWICQTNDDDLRDSLRNRWKVEVASDRSASVWTKETDEFNKNPASRQLPTEVKLSISLIHRFLLLRVFGLPDRVVHLFLRNFFRLDSSRSGEGPKVRVGCELEW